MDIGNKKTSSPKNWSPNDAENELWWYTNQPASSVNDNMQKVEGAIRRDFERRGAYLRSTGSANAYVLTYTPAPDGIYPGDVYCFIANFTNSGGATLNINGLGAIPIAWKANPILQYMIQTDGVVVVAYDGVAFEMISPPHSVLHDGANGGTFSNATLTNPTISGGSITGLSTPIPIASGGTGGATAAAAKTNLGFVTASDIGVSVQGYDVKTPKLNTANYWEKAQLAGGANYAVTISSSFTIDANTHPNCLYLTLSGDVTLATPTNFNGCGTLTLLCLNSGARNLYFGAGWYKLNSSNNWDTTASRWNIISVAWVGNATFFYNISQYA